MILLSQFKMSKLRIYKTVFLTQPLQIFIGPLRFSKLNVFLRLSVGPRDLSILCPRSQGYTSPPHLTHCDVDDDYKAQIIHKKRLGKN